MALFVVVPSHTAATYMATTFQLDAKTHNTVAKAAIQTHDHHADVT